MKRINVIFIIRSNVLKYYLKRSTATNSYLINRRCFASFKCWNEFYLNKIIQSELFRGLQKTAQIRLDETKFCSSTNDLLLHNIADTKRNADLSTLPISPFRHFDTRVQLL